MRQLEKLNRRKIRQDQCVSGTLGEAIAINVGENKADENGRWAWFQVRLMGHGYDRCAGDAVRDEARSREIERDREMSDKGHIPYLNIKSTVSNGNASYTGPV